ncbi:endo alpha-1,4 polygalactosaminidase [Hydrogenivirga sp.]
MLFYHHKPLPIDVIHAYDWIALDSDTPFIDTLKELFYLRRKTKLLGYISVGEIEKYRGYYSKLKKFVIGKNPMWNSEIVDLRSEEYINFVVDVVAEGVVKRGFDGFLLDTLDSYELVAEKEDFASFQKAEVKLIRRLKERYPDKMIVLNRGFEIIGGVYKLIDGVVVESLFSGLDAKRRYINVSEEERKKLLSILYKVKAKGIPVIVVDYVPPTDRDKAREIVRKIKELGFIPYVSDAELSRVGHSDCDIIPRRIVLLYDSALSRKAQEAGVHRLVQMPLEYLGFVPELYDVNGELPEVYPELGYRGVVTMYIDDKSKELDRWLLKAKDEGLKLFFINDFPFKNTRSALKELGILSEDNRDVNSLRVKFAREGHGYEAPLKPPLSDTLYSPLKGEPIVVMENGSGQRHVPFALTPWGGYAVDEVLLNDAELWVYDPFRVFSKVFGGGFPVPDTTTENGRRILTAHIDGDAFYGISEANPEKTNGEVIRDEILRKFRIPHTVSIIEGEVAPWGLFPERADKLEGIARSIFKLPNVEVASHSFSHPFTWQPEKMPEELLKYGYNLPVPDYKIDFAREIEGSIGYINSLAEPFGKRVRVFLWTGYCDPAEYQVKLTYRLKVFNVNGGDTTITNKEPFLSRISPMGLNYGYFFQVYAPVQNENIYTNEWTEPKWGYVNVIQSFKLTGKPRRLKPISIYYHFYSGQKPASLSALKEVYRYALSRETNPIFLSEFASKVLDFRDTAIIKKGSKFIIRNSGYLRTLRVKLESGYPDIERSEGVLGYRVEGDSLYVHLDGSGDNVLVLSKSKRDWFNIVDTNAQVKSYKRHGGKVLVELKSHVPIELKLDTGRCNVSVNGEPLPRGIHTYTGGLYAQVKATCPD